MGFPWSYKNRQESLARAHNLLLEAIRTYSLSTDEACRVRAWERIQRLVPVCADRLTVLLESQANGRH